MKKTIYFLFCFLMSTSLFSQSGLVSITSLQENISVCFDTSNYSVSIENPSPYELTLGIVDIELPVGVSYVPGSVTLATETDIADLGHPEFSTADISSLEIRTITIDVVTSCEVIDFISAGGILENEVHYNFFGDGETRDDYHTSPLYTSSQASISLISFTNQSYDGNVGETYDRCMTFTNGGTGSLYEFVLEDHYGASIDILGVSTGTLISSPGLDSIILDADDFTAIGNGDAYFDPGESITVCETVFLSSCFDAVSTIDYSWGCNGSTCQTLSVGANAVFGSEVPNLEYYNLTDDIVGCISEPGEFVGGASIINNGTGTAFNVDWVITSGNLQHTLDAGGIASGNNSSFDTSNFELLLNGVPVSFSGAFNIDSMSVGLPLACQDPSYQGVYMVIDSLQAGDTLTLNWEWLVCCPSLDDGIYQTEHTMGRMLSWGTRIDHYEDRCGGEFSEDYALGSFNFFRQVTLNGYGPGNIYDGESGKFRFEGINSGYIYPRNASHDMKRYEVILPSCLSYDPGSSYFYRFGALTDTSYAAHSVEISGDTVNFLMPTDAFWNLDFYLNLDCAGCADGLHDVVFNMYYSPDTTCAIGCEMWQTTDTIQVNLVCPDPCEGINVSRMVQRRKNFGGPDNDDNGFEDPSGEIDLDRVRHDRYIYNDTMMTQFTTSVINSSGTEEWPYLYAIIEMAGDGDGDHFEDAGVELSVYDASTGLYHTNAAVVTPVKTTIGDITTFQYELVIADLIADGYLPDGYFLDDGDSVLFTSDLVLGTNYHIGHLFSFNDTENRFFASDEVITDPDADAAHIFGCPEFLLGNFELVAFFRAAQQPLADVSIESCDTLTFRTAVYQGVGRFGYAGANRFQYEYRHFSYLDTFIVTMPAGYSFVSANCQLRQTGGTSVHKVSEVVELPLVAVEGDEYYFYTGDFFGPDSLVDTFYLPDEGWILQVDISMLPGCGVPDDVASVVPFSTVYNDIDQMIDVDVYPIRRDFPGGAAGFDITYNKPDLVLQCDLPDLNLPGNVAIWELVVDNNSFSSNASNAWLAFPTISAVEVDSVYDVTSAAYMYPDATGIFPIGDMNAGDNREFMVYGHFDECGTDSITAHLGWDCQGYPADFESYGCLTQQLPLAVTPLLPEVYSEVAIVGADYLELCDSTEMLITIENVQLGNAYDMTVNITIPDGMEIASGASEMKYPISDPFVSISDPTDLGGGVWSFDVSSVSDEISENGLPGILDVSMNEIQFKIEIEVGCEYLSGETIDIETTAYANCGSISDQLISIAPPLYVSGAVPDFNTEISLTTDFISPCSADSELEIQIINLGPNSWEEGDSVTIRLDPGLTYVSDSFIGDLNPPADEVPGVFTDVFGEFLTWGLPVGLGIGDTSRFTISVSSFADSLLCEIVQVEGIIRSSGEAICAVDSSVCEVGIQIMDTTGNVFVYKADLELADAGSFAIYNPPSGEVVEVNMDITNSGETIDFGNETIINYYYDTDGSGDYSLGDFLVESHTISDELLTGSTFEYTHSFSVEAAYTCQLIAVINPDENACICDITQLLIDFPISQLTDTVTICSGTAITIGGDPIDTYDYSWSPDEGLSLPDISEPVYDSLYVYPENDTIIYIRTVDRGGCFAEDTSIVINYSQPTANAGIDIELCAEYATVLEALAVVPDSGFWSIDADFDYPSDPTILDVNDPNSGISDLAEGDYVFLWTEENGVCPSAVDTVMVTIYNEPLSNAGEDLDFCDNESVTLEGNIPLGTSSGEWTVEAGPGIPLFSDVNDPTAVISELVEGTYSLVWTVYNGICPPVTDTVLVTISNSPFSDAGSDIELCDSVNLVLNGNELPEFAFGEWLIDGSVTAPADVIFDDETDPTTIASGLTEEGTYSFVWSVTNGICPTEYDTIAVTIYDRPTEAFVGDDQIVCAENSTEVEGNTPVGLASGEWSILDFTGDYPEIADINAPNTTINSLSEGTYSFIWTISNGVCPSISDTLGLTVVTAPVSDAGPDQEICNDLTEALLEANNLEDDEAGNWVLGDFTGFGITPYFGDAAAESTQFFGLEPGGVYSLIWKVNKEGCPEAVDTLLLDMVICEELNIPTGLSPNGDGANDVFYIEGIVGNDNVAISIFNRWGSLVYQSDSYQNDWDGTNSEGSSVGGNELPAGTYFYIIDLNDGSDIIKNYLHLER